MDIQSVKLRYGIIGNSPILERAISIALQISPTDLSALITGESGVGKEVFSKIIHQFSSRKHGSYIAVNCGAIPEGTIDSELFGHEKGSFTGANEARKGYFEVANGGTIFLDEVAEMPLSTQARLLRILETGEFIRVGSSKPQKTDVRIVAATNVNLQDAIYYGKFREDLFYRLNTVPIFIPPLRDRKDDIYLLFRKFTIDFSERLKISPIQLDDDSINLLKSYHWPGNVRQLKNITEQISIIEKNRIIDYKTFFKYLPADAVRSDLPVLFQDSKNMLNKNENFERELIYGFLTDLKRDVNDLKKLVADIITHANYNPELQNKSNILNTIINKNDNIIKTTLNNYENINSNYIHDFDNVEQVEVEDTQNLNDSLSIIKKEKDLIGMALKKHKGKRKFAAIDLGISERTLYRKIKEYNLEEI